MLVIGAGKASAAMARAVEAGGVFMLEPGVAGAPAALYKG
jgi:glycerate-2-kinase